MTRSQGNCKVAHAKARADAADKAFKELMQMEKKDDEKKKEEEPILGPMLNVRVDSTSWIVSKGVALGTAKDLNTTKELVFTGSLTFSWSEGKGARRVQVSLFCFNAELCRACMCVSTYACHMHA